MAASCSSNPCNSKPTPCWKYHVFLSFRGEDTRLNFTDHLYSALCKRGIVTFRDDEELARGEVIKHELLQAIEESLYAIVILSQNYASSSWCLDELQKILECKKAFSRGVLPIFYGIDPSIVRYQTGSFAEAFKKHEARFGEDKTKVQRWRDALSEIAGLSGYHSKNRHETELIEEIITALWRIVGPKLSSYSKDELVGIDTKLEKMYQILEVGSSEVRFVGIWGMGGIGKTTLAKLVFNQFRNHFDISCCLENVREKSAALDGLLGMQMKLLSKIKIGNLEIDNLDQGKATIRNLLFHKKVLLLLDDVDEIRQLEHLAGNIDWFGQGSRVLVTTRDMHLLELHKAPFRKYEIEVLNPVESFELFCLKAFKKNQPKEGYHELSNTVVQYGKGLPLALEILGSLLCGRDISIWEDVINRIIKDPPKNILDTLRVSYEGLEDAEKTIFLDIACFFKGWHKDRVTQILENCGFNHKIGIQILIERSLVKYYLEFVSMHDLVQEMGRKIVIQKSGNEISKQSRLWSSRDIDEVLKKNKGNEFIEGIVLEAHDYEARWDPKAFSKMFNLRILIILDDFALPLGLKCLSDSIKVLEWIGYPLKFLPHCEELNKLVELTIHRSKIKELWNGTQNFENLKFIDLSYSRDLIQTPNLFGAPKLESLILESCSNLVEIHPSVGQLKMLFVLNLKDCLNLKRLPSKFETNSLKYFILSGCSALRRLPEFGENIALERLDLSGCKGLASKSLYKPHFLKWKFLRQRVPMTPKMSSLSGLSMLRKLDASFCNLRDRSIPDDLSGFSSLEKLNLSGNNFTNLPLNCISNLSRLWKLDLSFCPKLQSLPVFPSSLRQVSARNCGLMEALPDVELWKLFMFDEAELRRPLVSGKIDGRRYVLSIPGSEIPAWFEQDKQQIFPLDNLDFLSNRLVRDSQNQKSFIVDIPDYCRTRNCKWWGIVASFVFEFEPLNIRAQTRDTEYDESLCMLCCCFKAPETEMCPYYDKPRRWYRLGEIDGGINLHQVIILFNGNDEYIQQVLREGHNRLKIFFHATRCWFEKVEGVNISKCAWRVIYKYEVNTEFENTASSSSHLSRLKEPRLTEISSSNEDLTATASNEELLAQQRKLKQKILVVSGAG